MRRTLLTTGTAGPTTTSGTLPLLGLSQLSRVRLDELLQEMLDRVGEVVTSRERLRALLDAVVAIGSDLDLRSTLRRIVEAACELLGARYGALGVIGPDRTSAEFITHGIDAESQRRDRRPTARPGRARPADRRPPSGTDAGHYQASPVRRFPGEPSPDAQLPRRSGPHPGSGLRQPLPGGEAGRRSSSPRMTKRSWSRWPPLPASRSRTPGCTPCPPSRAVVGGHRRDHDRAAGRGPPHGRAGPRRPPRSRGRGGRTGPGPALRRGGWAVHHRGRRGRRERLRRLVGAVLPAAETTFAASVTGRRPWPSRAWPRLRPGRLRSPKAGAGVPAVGGRDPATACWSWHTRPAGRHSATTCHCSASFRRAGRAGARARPGAGGAGTARRLEDRERIARDLHDVVIQRLFATGLQLQSARTADRPARRRPTGRRGRRRARPHDPRHPAGRSSSCARPMSAVAARPRSATLVDDAAGRSASGPRWSCPGRSTARCRTQCVPTSSRCCGRRCRTWSGTRAASQVRVLVRSTGTAHASRSTTTGSARAPTLPRSGLRQPAPRAPGPAVGDFEVQPPEPRGTRLCWTAPFALSARVRCHGC